ncbi:MULTISPECIES: hypothetical protein [Enterobacter cloacae complex]|nr:MULTISPECIES: hypothetical protein [Enterobacter cloacae complex]MDH1654643.1 hypothetical protein [Enterobacter roggenkampii]MDL0009377.1 hypothetical protein [Enterobacter roggenkampii]MDW5478510.1 hypothetical protein [Enterobacter ludwigii]MEA3670337.1 hypothetical protein [Enterobacter hormaechei]MEA3689007.1 hypothetical protein [Enterobacter hormaechei]
MKGIVRANCHGYGPAWRGVAWRGVAWRGVAWRGVAALKPDQQIL